MQLLNLFTKIKINPELVIVNIQAFNGYEDFILMFEGSLSLFITACITKLYTILLNKA